MSLMITIYHQHEEHHHDDQHEDHPHHLRLVCNDRSPTSSKAYIYCIVSEKLVFLLLCPTTDVIFHVSDFLTLASHHVYYKGGCKERCLDPLCM